MNGVEQVLNKLIEMQVEQKKLLDIIRKKGPISKNELMLSTKMKLSTLNRTLDPLFEQQLIEEVGTGESTGGRPPALLGVIVTSLYAVGVDISRTYTEVVLTDLKMSIVKKSRFELNEESSPEVTISKAIGIIRVFMKELNIKNEQVLGIGIGTVGPLSRKKGIIETPVNFLNPNWSNVPVKKMFEDAFRLPVLVDNGANSAVLGEAMFGEGKGYENIAYIHCGVGIRTGAVSRGMLIRTINDAEDAFGHMVVDIDGDACTCGHFGCIESYSSIYAIEKRFLSALKKGRKTNIEKPMQLIYFRDIFYAAEMEDALAVEHVTHAAVILGTGLANFINLLSPSLVILSGPSIRYSRLFYDEVVSAASKRIYNQRGSGVRFSRGGHFKESAISVGAAETMVEFYLNERKD